MRRFKLSNATGAEWDLMRRDAFFHAPEGLGMEREYTTTPTGMEFLILQEQLSQKTVSGEIVFRSYGVYTQFVAFISQGPLFLHYAPGNTWYQIRCEVSALEKSEMTNPFSLICPVSFLCFGTWHENLVVSQVQTPAAKNTKKYVYSYPYSYAETVAGSAVVPNGDLESPCTIQIFGPVINPKWALYKSGVQIADGGVNVTIPEGNKLVINSDPLEMEIAEYTLNNEYVQNRYSSSDFSTARFIYVPPGRSTISFTHEGTAGINAYVEVEKLAYTV